MTKQKIGVLLIPLIAVGFGIWSFLSSFQPALTAVNATTTVYYDANQGGTPDTQEMEYETAGFPFSQATQTFSGGATILDTTANINDYAGYGITPTKVVTLDAVDGFKMHFTMQIESESHTKNNRSGFDVILLDKNAVGIELSFWEDSIFALEGGTTNLFARAEEISFDTTSGLIPYELEIVGNTYTLSAPGMSTPLTGNTRDYSAFEPPFAGLPDPYEQPNFVFLGDNTTSGMARIRLTYVALTTDTAVTPPTNTPTASPTATATTLPTNTPTSTPTSTPQPTNTPDPSGSVPTATPHTLNLPFLNKP